MGHVKSHEDLDVWQAAMLLAEDCYKLSSSFPADERFGLTAQLRRSAVSVPCNIAERFGRDQTGGFLQFLRIAQGSLREAETQIALAVRLELAAPQRKSPIATFRFTHPTGDPIHALDP